MPHAPVRAHAGNGALLRVRRPRQVALILTLTLNLTLTLTLTLNLTLTLTVTVTLTLTRQVRPRGVAGGAALRPP